MHFYLYISALLLYYWLTNPFVHPWISCFLSFLCICFFICLCIVFSHVSLMYSLLISFVPFIYSLFIDYSFFCRTYSLLPAIYLLIYWLFSIHLSLYFCTHFVLFSHLSTHLFIYRLFVRLFIFLISLFLIYCSCPFPFSKKAGLIIDYSFFIYGILSVTPFRFNRRNILTDFGIYLSESL